MNKRQKKKRYKYDKLRLKLYSSVGFKPRNWSEIRWLYRYLRTRGLMYMLPFYSDDYIRFVKESEE